MDIRGSRQSSSSSEASSHDARSVAGPPVPPALTLYPHQQLRLPLRCLLADEMGLGKTLTVLAQWWRVLDFLASLPPGECQISRRPLAVFVVPLSVVPRWIAEHERLLGHAPYVYHGRCRDGAVQGHSSVVTTHETLVAEYKLHRRGVETLFFALRPGLPEWAFCAVDEAHVCRRQTTLVSRAVSCLSANCVQAVLASGTPAEKGWCDLAEMFRLLGVLGGSAADTGLGALLQRHCLWRTFASIGTVLPRRYETDIVCEHTPLQDAMFLEALRTARRRQPLTRPSDDDGDEQRSNKKRWMPLVLLGQIECAAALVHGQHELHRTCPGGGLLPPLSEDGTAAPGPDEVASLVLRGSGKLRELLVLLQRVWEPWLAAGGSSTSLPVGVVVFSRSVRLLWLVRLVVGRHPVLSRLTRGTKIGIYHAQCHDDFALGDVLQGAIGGEDGREVPGSKRRKRTRHRTAERATSSDDDGESDDKTPASMRLRDALERDFKSGAAGPLLLVSKMCGSVGVSFAERASVAVLLEPDPLPTIDEQAVRRLWRPGQTSSVSVFHMMGRRMDVVLRGYQRKAVKELAEIKPELWTAWWWRLDEYLRRREFVEYQDMCAHFRDGDGPTASADDDPS